MLQSELKWMFLILGAMIGIVRVMHWGEGSANLFVQESRTAILTFTV